jgi:hypothetical protein
LTHQFNFGPFRSKIILIHEICNEHCDFKIVQTHNITSSISANNISNTYIFVVTKNLNIKIYGTVILPAFYVCLEFDLAPEERILIEGDWVSGLKS